VLLGHPAAHIHQRIHDGCTALWLACDTGRDHTVRLLLGAGADPSIATNFGSTPLIVASSRGHLEVVRLLLGHPAASINERDHEGRTALWFACRNGRDVMVRLLLGAGADPSIATNLGSTPLMVAYSGRHLEVVRVLLGHPAAPINERDHDGSTALWHACRDGRDHMVRLLLEGGYDPSIATNLGSTPLMVASSGGHLEVVRVLLGHPIAQRTINNRSERRHGAVVGLLQGP
jgi:ankyrin repeat protein